MNCWKCYVIDGVSWLAVTAIFLAAIFARDFHTQTKFLWAIVVLLPIALAGARLHPRHFP